MINPPHSVHERKPAAQSSGFFLMENESVFAAVSLVKVESFSSRLHSGQSASLSPAEHHSMLSFQLSYLPP